MEITADTIWKKINPPAGGGIFVIAESGKTFIQTKKDRSVREYLGNAKELVDKAVWAGADAIKFQTHDVEDEQLPLEVHSPHFKAMDRYRWVKRNTDATPVKEFWKPLKEYCDQKGIVFFSAPMSRGAARRLSSAGVRLWKIGSGDILDFVMLDYVRNTGLPIIMSSGMSTLNEVQKGLKFLLEKNKRVALLHCLSKYPGRLDETNLAVMDLFREEFPGIPIGFSENSLSMESCLFAVALGAKVVERHVTKNRNLWGPDHKISSTPGELKKLIRGIRTIEQDPEERQKWLNHPNLKIAAGRKEKILNEGEEKFRPFFRKSLIAACDIAMGTTLTADMIYAMRPQFAGHIPSERYHEVIGKRAARALKKHEAITFDHLAFL